MVYFFTKEFERQLARLHQHGGIPKKMAQKFQHSAFQMVPGSKDPIRDNLKSTKHGESRMFNCQKFALSDDYRLVTQIHLKKWNINNYAIGGYGVQQMLTQIIKEPDVIMDVNILL